MGLVSDAVSSKPYVNIGIANITETMTETYTTTLITIKHK